MKLSTLNDWLNWIGSVHTKEIELGLDRIREVAGRLRVIKPDCPVIIVAGTNGKGSTVAGLEAIYQAAQYRVGAFTSPILFKHNEYVRLNGVEASDQAFYEAYEAIEKARQGITLTPFEYHTLAALLIFKQSSLDIMLLEVGLGGRLDAVNIIDPDVAVVTNISIDHVDWLGSTREAIAREKAGIFRKEGTAVFGEEAVPISLLNEAREKAVNLFCAGRDFQYQTGIDDWLWVSGKSKFEHLPYNALAVQNMANVLMVIQLMQEKRPVSEKQIREGLVNAVLPGRIQILSGEITRIFDVSHNPGSIQLLADKLKQLPCSGRTLAVFSMLSDKDIAGSVKLIEDQINVWFISPLSIKRGASLKELETIFAGKENVSYFSSVPDAYAAALKEAVPGDRVVVFGSFYTVAAVV